MVRAYGWAEVGGATGTIVGAPSTEVTPDLQASYPNAAITVYLTGTATLASLFADNAGTVQGNPFLADNNGYWFFYAANGRYDVQISSPQLPVPQTLGDIVLFDQNDPDITGAIISHP